MKKSSTPRRIKLSRARSAELRGTGGWWLSQIECGLEARRKYGNDVKWRDYEDYYMHADNKFNPNVPAFNLLYSQGRALLPSLAFRNPRIIVTPRRPEFTIGAYVLESIINWLCVEMEVVNVAKRATLQSFLRNIGPIQVGFDFVNEGDKDKPDAYTGRAGVPGVVDRARRSNFPWLDGIEPEKLVFAPGTKDVRTARWFAKLCVRPTVDLKADKELNQKAVEVTHIPNNLRYGMNIRKELGLEDDIEEYTSYWEIHDQSTGKWQWMTVTGKNLFEPENDPLQVDGLPLECIIFNENTRSIWGTPDAKYIVPIMNEGNDCRIAGMRQRRLACVKFLIREKMITEAEIEKLLAPDCPAVIRIKDEEMDKSLTESIVQLQPHVQLEFEQVKQSLIYDSQLLMGFGPNQMGQFAPGRRTKYEAQVVEERNLMRTTERQEMVANTISSLMRKVIQLVRSEWTTETVYRVVGMDGMLYWVNLNPSELKDEVDVSVDVESMMPPSVNRTRDEQMRMIETLAKLPGANVLPLVQQLLRSFSWADVNKYLPSSQQQPIDMQQFQAQQSGLERQQGIGQTAANNLTGIRQMLASNPK